MNTLRLEDVVYSRPDIEGLKGIIEMAISEMKTITEYSSFREKFMTVKRHSNESMSMYKIVSIRYRLNTNDKFYEEEQTYWDGVMPSMSKTNTDFKNMLLDSPFRSDLEAEYGKQFLDLAELDRKSINEDVIPLLQKENLLTSEYLKITSQIKIEFEGKSYNTAGMSPLTQHVDRDIRKRSSKALYAEMLKAQPEYDRIYDELVQVRTEIAQKLGYKSFTSVGYLRMGRTCYGPNEVAKYRELVLKYITPKVTDIKSRIAQSLGIDCAYQYDNIDFPDGNATPKTSPKQMVADAQIMYNELSKETGEFFQMMQDKGMLDLVNREGKSPGGFCTYVEAVKSPFIYSNFNQTSHDVDVLTHEAGHAFQCYCSMHFDLSEYYFPTSESAEIHSMSMEFFAMKWVDKFFKEDTAKYKLGHLLGSFTFLPYMVSVDEFQHRMYDEPSLSPEQRRNVWNEIQSKYMPWTKIDNEPFLENGGRWQNQRHIYKSPFYYIDYALAQLCAFQFHKKMNENHELAWEDYHRLCKAGGSKNFLELLDIANLKSPFIEDGFKATVDFIYNEIDQRINEYYSAKSV